MKEARKEKTAMLMQLGIKVICLFGEQRKINFPSLPVCLLHPLFAAAAASSDKLTFAVQDEYNFIRRISEKCACF